MRSIIIILLCAMFCVMASNAYARISSIPNALVNEGVWRLNWRNSYNIDEEKYNHRIRSRIGVDYGFTDNYAWLLMLQGQDMQQQSPELTHLMFDQRFELTDTRTHGYYSGLRLRYEARLLDNQSDIPHIRLILGKEIGAWDFRFNQILGIEVGEGRKAGAIIDSRFHVAYRYDEKHSVGMESFSNFGNVAQINGFAAQSHSVGPTFFGALSDEINYEAGYMAGVSKAAPDHSFYFGFMRDF